MRPLAVLPSLLIASLALAHPMSRDKYSLRTAVRADRERLEAVVVLEVPFDVVMADIKSQLEAAREQPGGRKVAQDVVDAYAQKQFATMAAGLSLTVDGAAVPGRFQAKQSPYNGKGAVSEGFFVYIVEFRAAGEVPLDDDITVVVSNAAYAEAQMVYSAWAFPSSDYEVVSHSASSKLPARAYDPVDSAFWVDDAALRTFEARLKKKTP